MTFATFAPGQVTAKHPCIAQFIVRLSAIEVPQRPGELESSIIEKVRGIPNSIFIDPELKISDTISPVVFGRLLSPTFIMAAQRRASPPERDVGIWFMNSTSVSSVTNYGNVGTSWSVHTLAAE